MGEIDRSKDNKYQKNSRDYLQLKALREPILYHFVCFFIKFIKGWGWGGSFPFIKIYEANFGNIKLYRKDLLRAQGSLFFI